MGNSLGKSQFASDGRDDWQASCSGGKQQRRQVSTPTKLIPCFGRPYFEQTEFEHLPPVSCFDLPQRCQGKSISEPRRLVRSSTDGVPVSSIERSKQEKALLSLAIMQLESLEVAAAETHQIEPAVAVKRDFYVVQSVVQVPSRAADTQSATLELQGLGSILLDFSASKTAFFVTEGVPQMNEQGVVSYPIQRLLKETHCSRQSELRQKEHLVAIQVTPSSKSSVSDSLEAEPLPSKEDMQAAMKKIEQLEEQVSALQQELASMQSKLKQVEQQSTLGLSNQ